MIKRLGRNILIALVAVAATMIAFRMIVLRPPLVSVAEVMRGDLASEVEGTGTVTADAIAEIASKITGRVEQVFADEGDFVRQGQTVAMLDETELRRQVDVAHARLNAAKVTAEEQQREWDRETGLVKSGAESVEDSQQYAERLAVAKNAVVAARAESQAAEYNLSLTRIPSLFSGIVTKRWVVPGASIVPGQKLFTVADTRLIYVSAYLDQDFTGKLAKGQTATVILRGRENAPLEGRVLRMNPQADSATEETIAEVEVAIPRDEFQLGEWANVFIQVGTTKQALLVPREALMHMNNHAFVFVVGTNDVLRREAVTVLAQSPRRPMVAVSGHLRPHERIVLMPMGLSPGELIRIRQGASMPGMGGTS